MIATVSPAVYLVLMNEKERLVEFFGCDVFLFFLQIADVFAAIKFHVS